MFAWKCLVLSLALILACAFNLFAQTTGGIRGIVSDSEGQPVSGATITITSSALIGATRTATTNELGVFRFPSLPLGTYQVEASLHGFQNVQAQNVQVSLGATANVPLTMKLAGVNESMTVTGETPVLDVAKSGLSSSYKNEMLTEVPTQRSMWDLMQASPGMTVDVGDSQSARVIAFGSNRQSNSWNIDGMDVTAPETGDAWWYVNPDVIEEVQVLGVGAPAEYGNHTGAVLNVVTKKGSNQFHGVANYFFQGPNLTGVNVRLPDSPFTFHRDVYGDLTAQLGGPILRDKVWFFGGVERWRDGSSQPGTPPNFAPTQKSDKYDLKVSARVGEKNEVTGFVHQEEYAYPDTPSQFITQSALGNELGNNPAWGGTFTSTLNKNLLLELNYSGWTSNDRYKSETGSLADPFFDYTPPDGGPPEYSGGLYGPYDYVTSRHQAKGKLTYYADHFMKSQHEFRFGIQYSHGNADTVAAIGANGVYTYSYGGYLYQATQEPFEYGGISNETGIFVDDTVTLNKNLTLNLGVRFDHNAASIPDFNKIVVGQPSFTDVGNWQKSSQTIPGIHNFIDWNLVSPRVGFTWQPRGDGRSVIEGSFGVYYDHDVMGNWDSPPPERPVFSLYGFDPDTGQFDVLINQDSPANIRFNRDIKAPRTLQYAAGYEQQITNDSSFGVQYVYKDTKNLVGWTIDGGGWNPVPFTDPFTGKQYTILSLDPDNQPTLSKGNTPGDFPGSAGLRYFQKYQGLVFTYNKRFSDKWGINASYTWSRSTGLIPRMLGQEQFSPFYSARDGSDPNNFINAEGRLQGDRPSMFRLQAVMFKLPWEIEASTAMEFSSGRAYSRQIRIGSLGQGTAVAIMEPIGTFRYSPITSIDFTVGKRFPLGKQMRLRLEGTVYNLLNSDQELSFATLELQSTDQTFVPDTWVKPRRLQLRAGFEF